MKGHFEMESPLSSRQNSLTFEPCENYTKGIDVQQVMIYSTSHCCDGPIRISHSVLGIVTA